MLIGLTLSVCAGDRASKLCRESAPSATLNSFFCVYASLFDSILSNAGCSLPGEQRATIKCKH